MAGQAQATPSQSLRLQPPRRRDASRDSLSPITPEHAGAPGYDKFTRSRFPMSRPRRSFAVAGEPPAVM